MQPEDLTKYLNEYFSEMTKIAVKYGATIDKYIGDSMMVFFGDPETKRGERRCQDLYRDGIGDARENGGVTREVGSRRFCRAI